MKLIDEMVKNMFFFMKFGNKIREKILLKAELKSYDEGHVLFREGDFGDKMYIIIKGSVNVIISEKNKFSGQVSKRLAAWITEGNSFGEYSMLGGKSRNKKKTVYMQIKEITDKMVKRSDYLKTGIFYGQKIDLKSNNPII